MCQPHPTVYRNYTPSVLWQKQEDKKNKKKKKQEEENKIGLLRGKTKTLWKFG